MFWSKPKEPTCAANAEAEWARHQRIRSLNVETFHLLRTDRPILTVQERLREIELEMDALEALDAAPNH